MAEHWTVAALGEDLGETDPYVMITLLREKLKIETGAKKYLIDEALRIRGHLAACVTARDEAATAYAERVRVLREALGEAEEFFDDRADAEIIDSGYLANAEMRLLMVVRSALEATK
jgi:hypothetical protein